MAHTQSARPWAGYLLGFALGGFFDGILLHQILQWHHLLLAIQTGPFRELRTQIAADGVFHLLMYVVAIVGLRSLWRARTVQSYSQRALLADVLIGFGAWHALDAVLSHWILGIHRIRMDSPNPLAWDLGWLVVFGLLPLAIGVLMRKRPDDGESTRLNATPIALVLAVLIAGGVAGRAPANAESIAVLVRPTDVNRLLDALPAVEGRVMWADRSGALWLFKAPREASLHQLYDAGALWVTRSPIAIGCLAWTRS